MYNLISIYKETDFMFSLFFFFFFFFTFLIFFLFYFNFKKKFFLFFFFFFFFFFYILYEDVSRIRSWSVECWFKCLLLCRSQMQTIITNSCNELRIRPVPSKRVSMEKLLYEF